jgi:hypothetical protein
MRNILFLNRVSLIGNLAFIAIIVMRYWGNVFSNTLISSYVITAGYSVLTLNVWLIIIFLNKKGRSYFACVPIWLISLNLFFCIIEVIFIIIPYL